ncbi:hypothetical protein [Nocardia sp. NPDC004860]|uniref:hypothetical protein n=1 Tax=Nocardia sp. NPDC004860 TaxID=3154557 RepID=UPI00339F9C3C
MSVRRARRTTLLRRIGCPKRYRLERYLLGVRVVGDLLGRSDTELLGIPGIGGHGVALVADARHPLRRGPGRGEARGRLERLPVGDTAPS